MEKMTVLQGKMKKRGENAHAEVRAGKNAFFHNRVSNIIGNRYRSHEDRVNEVGVAINDFYEMGGEFSERDIASLYGKVHAEQKYVAERSDKIVNSDKVLTSIGELKYGLRNEFGAVKAESVDAVKGLEDKVDDGTLKVGAGLDQKKYHRMAGGVIPEVVKGVAYTALGFIGGLFVKDVMNNNAVDKAALEIFARPSVAVVNTDLSFLEKTGANFYGGYELDVTIPVVEERHGPLIETVGAVEDVNDYAVKDFVGPMPVEKAAIVEAEVEIQEVEVKKKTGPLELIGGVLEFGNHAIKDAVYGVGGLAKGGVGLALGVGEVGVGAGLNITEGGICVVGEGVKNIVNVASRPLGGVAGGLEGALTGNGNSFDNGWKEAGEITDGIFDGAGKTAEGTFAVARGLNKDAFYLMRQENDGLFHVAGNVGDEFFDNFYGGKRYNEFHDKLLRMKPGEALGVLNDDGNWLLSLLRGAQIYIEDALIWNLFSGGDGSGSGSGGGLTRSTDGGLTRK